LPSGSMFMVGGVASSDGQIADCGIDLACVLTLCVI
jgi:hypothetical protein